MHYGVDRERSSDDSTRKADVRANRYIHTHSEPVLCRTYFSRPPVRACTVYSRAGPAGQEFPGTQAWREIIIITCARRARKASVGDVRLGP